MLIRNKNAKMRQRNDPMQRNAFALSTKLSIKKQQQQPKFILILATKQQHRKNTTYINIFAAVSFQ